MPEIKRKGVLIRPGKYNLRGKDEIRTITGLKEAIDIAKRLDGIMLTYGHATDGSAIPSPAQVVGKAFPYWDSEKKAVLADYSFFEEYWDKIPENVRNKIVNKDSVPISVGYRVDDVDKDGTQRGILFTHVALVSDGEEPIADNVGVNVRMESKRELERELDLHPNYRLESGEIQEVQPQVESESVPEPELIESLKTRFDALEAKYNELFESMKPTDQKSEVIEEPELPAPIAEETEAVPEVLIPPSDASEHPWTEDEDGMIVFKPLQTIKNKW